MGFCIMFPWLCGLKTKQVADMRELVIDISTDLEETLMNGSDDIEERKMLVEDAYDEAVSVLNENGFDI